MEYKVKGSAVYANVRNASGVCCQEATQVALQLAWHMDRAA